MPETCLLSSSRRRLLLVPGLFSLHQELWVSLFGLAVVVGDLQNPNFKFKMLIGNYLVLVDINITTLVGCVLLLFNTLFGKSRLHIVPMFFRISVNYTLIQNLPVAQPLVAVPRMILPLFLSCHGCIQNLVHHRSLLQVLF